MTNDDDVVEMGCDCCGTTRRIHKRNLERIGNAVWLRSGSQPEGSAVIDLSYIPDDIDLADPHVSGRAIARVVQAASREAL